MSHLLNALVGQEIDLVLEELHVDALHQGDLIDSDEHSHEDKFVQVGLGH